MKNQIGPFAVIVPARIAANSDEVLQILDQKVKFSEEFSTNGLAPATHFGTVTELDEDFYMAYRNKGGTQFGEHIDAERLKNKQDALFTAGQFRDNVLISEAKVELRVFAYLNGLVPVGAAQPGVAEVTKEDVAAAKAKAAELDKQAKKDAEDAEASKVAEEKALAKAKADQEKADAKK